jgi:hypothetical protein
MDGKIFAVKSWTYFFPTVSERNNLIIFHFFFFLSVFEFENTVSHSDQIFPPDSLQNGRLQQFSSYFIPNEICDCPVSQG